MPTPHACRLFLRDFQRRVGAGPRTLITVLEDLHRVLEHLPVLLRDGAAWQSLHITYHPPRVERLWLQLDARRVLLHRIHPCEPGEALWHPHPWPSAVKIIAGRYAHGVSLGDAHDPLPRRDRRVLHRGILVPGSEYEMTDRDTWHCVRPVGAPVDSVMLIGAPYEPRVLMPEAPRVAQSPLEPARAEALLQQWRRRFASADGPRDLE